MINSIKTVRVKNIVEECSNIRTISFNMRELEVNIYNQPKPGQFVMVWVPGVDEIPMSISACNDMGDWSFTVKNIGECTNALFDIKVNDYIGIRGPYGNSFSLPIKKIKKAFLIGGGTGIAPLNYLSQILNKKGIKTVIIYGARVIDELIFTNNLKNSNNELSEILYCTDDGSYGEKGFASETFRNLIMKESLEQLKSVIVYTCGPEKMMYNVFKICENKKIEVQASLERMMRCGCGLCGLCAVDPLGLLVCKDGPIFNSKTLREMDDFGKYKRDMSGKKIPL